MGNRAVITTEDKTIGVYFHWQGGYDFVYPLLQFCSDIGIPSPEKNPVLGFGAIANIMRAFNTPTKQLFYIPSFVMDSLVDDVEINLYERLDCDNHDNGVVYVIKNWKIIKRLFHECPEQVAYDFGEMYKRYHKAFKKIKNAEEMFL